VNSVFVSRENRRLLTVSNDSSRARSLWKNPISARSRYSIFAIYDSSQSRSSWKNSIFASLLWIDFVSTRSRDDSRYCIRLPYLSENDLSEDDFALFWTSHFRKTSIHHDINPGWIFFLREKAVVRSILLRKNQNRSESTTSTYFY
jgi:hypothetical protein